MRFASIFSATAFLGMTMAAVAAAAAVDILTPSSSPPTPTEQGKSSQAGVQLSRGVVQDASDGFRFQSQECNLKLTLIGGKMRHKRSALTTPPTRTCALPFIGRSASKRLLTHGPQYKAPLYWDLSIAYSLFLYPVYPN
ncbi:BZ3500_MvSof-1268-A1-R1_Chr8-2g10274 [Microbotryum saponariae]|uniref:BZ3500_MvSof-1268-A1-R1_Chr8-2g10274 protein n=1 Tax=Microbotryum saponariae TaxID=289078 RepID=A0A2X0N4N2_9BASI|nr:BZ3500_MvSof-1268-A1-R1_Chr8-2g10274 [Microbotryum saponariae]SDA02072.1 BZ3501_MvSof-1269-A2-R1_Chr8-2g10024 [Microbotryum saponariae]